MQAKSTLAEFYRRQRAESAADILAIALSDIMLVGLTPATRNAARYALDTFSAVQRANAEARIRELSEVQS